MEPSSSPASATEPATRVRLHRVLALLSGSLGAAALLTYLGTEWIRWAAVVLAAGATLSALAAYRLSPHSPLPQVRAEQESFRVPFPGAWAAAAEFLAVALGVLLLLAAAGEILLDLARQSPIGLAMVGALAPAILLGLVCAVAYVWGAGNATLSAQGDPTGLLITRLRGRRLLPPADLLIERLQHPDGRLHALVLHSCGKTFRLPSASDPQTQPQQLEGIAEWLTARGARQSVSLQVVSPSHSKPVAGVAFQLVLITAALFFSLLIVRAIAFWYGWWRQGCYDIDLYLNWSFPAGILLSYFLALGPPRGWFWKLATAAWRPRPANVYPVEVTQPFPSLALHIAETAGGSLRIEGRTLLLHTGGTEFRIEPEQVLSVTSSREPTGVLLRPAHGRLRRHPVALSWRASASSTATVLLASSGGRGFGQDRRLDRQLYDRLRLWTDTPESAHSLPRPGSPAVGALLAVLLLSLGLAGPLIHNHFVHRIVSGDLLPAETLRPSSSPVAAALRVQAWPAAAVPGVEVVQDPVQIRIWKIVPDELWPRLLTFGGLPGVLSFPHGPSAYLELENPFLGMSFLTPFLLTQAKQASQVTPRLVDVDTGRAILLPELARGLNPQVLALYGNSRLFLAEEIRREELKAFGPPPPGTFLDGSPGAPQFPTMTSTTLELRWLDVESRRFRSLGRHQVTATLPSALPPLFFPGGESVLWNWHVVHLSSGTLRPISFPEGAPEPPATPEWKFFSGGDRLRVAEDWRLRRAQGSPAGDRIWEIDPDKAEIRLVRELPPDTSLLSADGNRWLLGRRNEIGNELALSLLDVSSDKTVDLGPAPPDSTSHRLTAGSNDLYYDLPDESWARQELPPLPSP